jgi:hypothetical protein
MRDTVQASLVVTGSLDIERDGSVGHFVVDQPERLPPGVVQLIDDSVPKWRFDPIRKEGQPVPAATRMRIQVLAHQVDAKHLSIELGGVSFGDETDTTGESVVGKTLSPPAFPARTFGAGIGGTVSLVILIDKQGHVKDAVVEQVNLRATGSPVEMHQWREAFAKSSMKAAMTWTFTPPTVGESARQAEWSVRVPIDFGFEGTAKPYGKWNAYMPGPIQRAPWLHDHDFDNWPDADLLLTGGVYEVGKGPHLLTALSPG